MKNEIQEKVADIVAKIRSVAYIQTAESPSSVLQFADRIEAAHKRELEATREYSSQVGNAAMMREALEKVRFYLPHFLQYMRLHREDAEAGGYYESILEIVNAAISSPQRNCDVGTQEGQSARFDDHCRKHIGCLTCPLREKDGGVPKHCEFAWAQMPYEVGGEE